jgi:hypothetical protein
MHTFSTEGNHSAAPQFKMSDAKEDHDDPSFPDTGVVETTTNGGDHHEEEEPGAQGNNTTVEPAALYPGSEDDVPSEHEGDDEEEEEEIIGKPSQEEIDAADPVIISQLELIHSSTPTTALEKAYHETLLRKEAHIQRLTMECDKMRQFVRKRKQSYKRKRKEDAAPRRALSGYNLFIKERFEELQRENEKALQSDDKDATLRRVPPKNLVTRTGNEWKALPPEIKAQYDER